MFSYIITRYSPAWEVQSGGTTKEDKGPLADHARFFRKINESSVDRLKNMIYANGFMPAEVQKMNAERLESYLAGNRLVMHYRIQYEDYNIFIAHLNNSPSRAIIPFRISGERWLLDPSFTDSEFFRLISDPNYNPFTGLNTGTAICDFGFEEVENDGTIYDYSGKQHHAMASRASIVDGRIGGALKLNPDAEVSINLVNEQNLKGDRFAIDFHINISKLQFNRDRKRTVFTSMANNEEPLTLYLEEGLLYLKVEDLGPIHIPFSYDNWFHLTISQNNRKLAVTVDGTQVSAKTIHSSDVLYGTDIRFGGRYSFKGTIDEFRISR